MSRLPTRVTRSGRVLEDAFFKKAKASGYVSRAAYKLEELQRKFSLIRPGGRVLDLGCHPGAWLQVANEAIGPPSKGGLVVGVDLSPATRVPTRRCDGRVRVIVADAREVGRATWDDLGGGRGFTCVLSDMCHDTVGAGSADAARSAQLVRAALSVALGDEWGEADTERRAAGRDGEDLGWDDDAVGGWGSEEGGSAGEWGGVESLLGGGPRGGSAGEPSTSPEVAPPPAPESWRGVLVPGGSVALKILQGPGSKELALALRPMFEKVAWHRPAATRKESKEAYLIGIGRRAEAGEGAGGGPRRGRTFLGTRRA